MTLGELKTLIRQRADQENSEFISESELDSYVNASCGELFDLLVNTNEDYYTSSSGITVSDSSGILPLPTNCYKIRGVDYAIDNTRYQTVRSFEFLSRNQLNNSDSLLGNYPFHPQVRYKILGNNLMLLPASQANGTYKLWFIPYFTILSSDSSSVDSAMLPWIEYVVADCAAKLAAKEESDLRPFLAAKDGMRQRIQATATIRDQSEPHQVTRTRSRGRRGIGPFGY